MKAKCLHVILLALVFSSTSVLTMAQDKSDEDLLKELDEALEEDSEVADEELYAESDDEDAGLEPLAEGDMGEDRGMFEQLVENVSGKVVDRYTYFFGKMNVREGDDPDNQLHTFEFLVELSSYIQHRQWLRFDIDGWAEFGSPKYIYTAKFADLGDKRWQEWLQDDDVQRHYVEISEAYLSLMFPVIDISLGRRIFVNTLSTIYTPADVYRVYDTNDPFNPKAIGKWQFQFDMYIGDFILTAIVFPVYQSSKPPHPWSRWGYYTYLEQEEEEDQEKLENRYLPDITWENISYLLRGKAIIENWDFFLAGFHGLTNNLVTKGEDDDEVVHVLNVSAGFSSVFGFFEIHAEALWNYTYDLKDDHYLRYVGGAKLTYDIVLEEEDIQIKIEPTLEYAGEWLIERQSYPDYSNSTQGRRYFTNSLLASFLFRINEISFYLNAQYEFDRGGFLFGAWSEFELEMFKFNIGLQYFPDTPSSSSYHNWRHNDRIVGSITYSF